MSKLKPEDFLRIRERVIEAEKHTTGEIVPLVLRDASEYHWVHALAALQGLVIGILAAVVWELTHVWPITPMEVHLLALGGGLLGLFLSFIPSVARALIGEKRLEREAQTRAYAEFVRQGCAETVGRTGVLVLVCLFEHRIVIVADRGVQKKAVEAEGAEVWAKLCHDFSENAKAGKAIDGLGIVIERIGALLAKHFPGHGPEHDELPNDLRKGEWE